MVVVVVVPKGSQRKKARTESEPRGSGQRMEEQMEWTLQEEIHDLGKCLLVRWDWQNWHMEQLVDLKSKEIWGAGLEKHNEDIDTGMEREELERLTRSRLWRSEEWLLSCLV